MTSFNYVGGGAVTFSSPESAGGTHNNRFIINTEVRTSGTRFSTTHPGRSSSPARARARSPPASPSTSNTRTNVGCFNQSDAANTIKATVLDSTGKLTLGSVDTEPSGRTRGDRPP